MSEQQISNSLKLSSLEIEYDNTLSQYKQAYKNYNEILNSSKTKKYDRIKGSALWGSSKLSEKQVKTMEECEALCSSNKSCSGATYNSNKKYCWIQGGESVVSTGGSGDYALYPVLKKYHDQLQTINMKLVDINTQIFDIINSDQSMYVNDVSNTQQLKSELQINYNNLLNDRLNVNNTLNDYNTYENKSNISGLNASKSYIQYLMLFIILFTLVVMLAIIALK